MIKNNPANTNIGNISEIAQAIPGAINTLTSPFQTSTATTGGEAIMQSLTGIAEGAGSGAQLGMTMGIRTCRWFSRWYCWCSSWSYW